MIRILRKQEKTVIPSGPRWGSVAVVLYKEHQFSCGAGRFYGMCAFLVVGTLSWLPGSGSNLVQQEHGKTMDCLLELRWSEQSKFLRGVMFSVACEKGAGSPRRAVKNENHAI